MYHIVIHLLIQQIYTEYLLIANVLGHLEILVNKVEFPASCFSWGDTY